MATPMPRPQSAVPEIYALAQRRGTTVGMTRRPNYCSWAVLGEDGTLVVGPRAGEPVNPGDRELGLLIAAAIDEVGAGQKVFLLDYKLADLLEQASATFDATTSAPPFGARSTIEEAIAKRSSKMCMNITLFSDASKGSGNTLRTGWSISYQNGPDPIFGASAHRSPVGVCGAELLAIRDGLHDIEMMHPQLMAAGLLKVTVRSDSRDALKIVDSMLSGDEVPKYHPALREVCKAIVAFADRAKLRTEWVRGHDGNPGNEAADRLAVNARRVAEFNTPQDVARQLLREIIVDERTNLKAA